MDEQGSRTSVEARQGLCEEALACKIMELIDEATDEGFSVPEAVQAIVKISHAVYMREGAFSRHLVRKDIGSQKIGRK